MAVKKTVAETAEVIAQAPAADMNPWKEMVSIKIPKAPKGGENYVIASVNGRVYKIKRGTTVEVPAPIAEVIRHSEEMQDEADRYMEEQLKKADAMA